jgi:hypothetical protein
MVKSSQESDKNLNLDSPEKGLCNSHSKRQEYVDLIDRLVETAYTKAQGKYCKNSERISWIRAITGLVNAGNQVLKDQDLEELSQRLERLEKLFEESQHKE